MSISSHTGRFSPPTVDAAGRVPLIGLALPEVVMTITANDLPAFRAKQIWHWIYKRGVRNFTDMINLPKDVRVLLAEKYSIERPDAVTSLRSTDGTIKWLLSLSDGQQIETVFIPEAKRGTLCVSSQVGCTLTCKFCHTGTQPLVRNLSAHEILQQIMFARDALDEWPRSGEGKQQPDDVSKLTNIVIMGMGEPLFNYNNIVQALKICMDPDGLAVSKRRITLSTSGIASMIRQCGDDLGVNLAVSLHASTDEIRSKLMPINKKYPLAEVLDACRTYPIASDVRRITFEYIMLRDVNDSDDDAVRLTKLLHGIHSKINIIPFNEWEGSGFECSTEAQIGSFARILENAGYEAPVRRPRGRDIMAACGQLRSASIRART
ncbi:MAG: 23S rRNA (adenine(2503)-C(2))-methyltransferase RlmN [Alphaproteobacteria bacterium]|nr:23S rRNA (adenine(2503)-C(2))-methyltransferase RlmN [Alphaproteobacteria bacterium]MCK5659110.1 23S rRNA (adenine(2503)-C(2))-methyltransferase RlmN [Alphaproteobacteria bacterium]